MYIVFTSFSIYRDQYIIRFPELESLVPTPLEYMRTIKELGNDLDKCKNNPVLQQVPSLNFYISFSHHLFEAL